MGTELTIVKIGGNVIDDAVMLDRVLCDFMELSGAKILVHGGGKSASKLSERLGITSQYHQGRRITSSEELKIVTKVYAGWISKSIVAQLSALGANALGLCGADCNVIRAKKRSATPIDFGFVGDVESVNTVFLKMLLEQEIVPVLSAITHDGTGNLLNTNADTIAGSVAGALAGDFNVRLIYCFEKQGVLFNEEDETSVVSKISKIEFEEWTKKGILHSGILPKIQNCLDAVDSGVGEVYITNAMNLHLDQPKTSFV